MENQCFTNKKRSFLLVFVDGASITKNPVYQSFETNIKNNIRKKC